MATVIPQPAAKPAASAGKPTQPSQPKLVEVHDSITKEDPRERLMRRQVPAVVVSGGLHFALALVFFIAAGYQASTVTAPPENTIVETKVDDAPPEKQNFENTDIGLNPEKQTNYNNDRIEDISVPGIVRPEEPVGIEGAPKGPAQTIPPPAGFGGGQGGGMEGAAPGNASMFGDAGGFAGGRTMTGMAFSGRSGATRQKMVEEGGGNKASEASVAEGLIWLQRQQKADGHWEFDGNIKDDTGATGLALLPFLAAGQTHIPAKGEKDGKYTQTVARGLQYLVNKIQTNGKFKTANDGHYMYGHALSTLALCEAFGMTNDPKLKKPAQDALDYIRKGQHATGSWNYNPGSAGDSSITAWQLQALKSGYLAGLSVPRETMNKVNNYLDTIQTADGAAYGYRTPGASANLTAACLLCRQYLGWGPKNPKLIAGVERLKAGPPEKGKREIYYYYYATQVVHFYGGDVWDKFWNPKMRDMLIDTQDRSTGKDRGSWAPTTTLSDKSGGRLYVSCLSLLTLEVYYRHLPLYKRDGSGLAELER